MRTVAITGVDTAGKTTLADGLAKFGYGVVHSRYQPDADDLFGHYRDLLAGLEGDVVLDRGFITEFVYGPVLRGVSRISGAQFDRLAATLAARRGVVVYAYQDPDVLEARLQASLVRHPKHRVTLEHLGELLLRYAEVMERLIRVVPTLCVKSVPAASPAWLAALLEEVV